MGSWLTPTTAITDPPTIKRSLRKWVWRGWNAPTPDLSVSLCRCLSLQASSSLIQFWPCLAEVALAPPTGSSATISDGSAAYADARYVVAAFTTARVPPFLRSLRCRQEDWGRRSRESKPAVHPARRIY